MPILKRRCPVDGTEFDLLSIRGELSALNHDDLDHLGCPKCGAEGEAIVAGFLGKDLGGEAGVGKLYPYFDRALRCHVRDAAHRRWLLEHYPDGRKREHKLIPTDGDFDPAEAAEEERRASEAIEKKAKEQQDYYEHGPDREGWGRLQELLKDPRAAAELWRE